MTIHSSLHPHNGNGLVGAEATGLQSSAAGPVVGIPRGLLYFRYQPLWTTFFAHLGVATQVSQPTERSRFEYAQSLTRSDLCLPVKVFLDHVARLKDSVDYILLPRVISVSPDAYMCPKILGLTDMVRNVFPNLPGLLTPRINAKLPKPEGFAGACFEVGHHFENSQVRVEKAWEAAQQAQVEFEQRLLSYPLDQALGPWDETFSEQDSTAAFQPRYQVAVIGRPYITFDSALSHDLLDLLKRHGVQIVTPESLPREVKDRESQKLSKQVYWQMGKELVAAAMHYMHCPEVDGIINVSSFGCGQDSFTNALVEYYVIKHSNKAYLNLVMDEHTADAGLNTRVEAFLDMVDQRTKIGSFQSRAIEEKPGPFSSKKLVKQPTSPEMHLTIPHMGHLHIG
ncbi:MAG: acyl-CoA dehydratase activase-related protein, partial [Syntrophobacterales bacterium]